MVAILCLFAIASLAALAVSIRDKNAADKRFGAQLALVHMELHAQEIRDLEWLAVATRETTPESEAHLQQASQELATIASSLPSRISGTVDGQFVSTVADFTRSAEQQLELIRTGKLEKAQQVEIEEAGPQFDALQRQVHQVKDAEQRLADHVITRSRVEFALAILLAAISVLIVFLRLQRKRQIARTRHTALEQSEERFRALTEQATDIVFITDAAGVVTYASPSLEKVLTLVGTEYVARNFAEHVHPGDVAKIEAAMRVPAGEYSTVELRLRHADGRWLYFECTIRNLLQQENIAGMVVNAREITERKKAEEQLLFNASHDHLTGLPNRVFFLNRLQTVMEQIRRHRQPMAAVLFVDVDDFKVVNDCLGHAAGDELIVQLAERLKSCMRSDGSVARMGGDEFTVLLEDITDPSDAIRVADRIHEATAKPFLLQAQELCKGVSIGVALAAENGTAEMVVQNADMAMYRAKAQGRARTELFDAAMHAKIMGQLQLEGRLRRGLQNQEFRLYFQPIVAIATGAIEGFEALLRWQPAGSDPVSPGVFIPVAEKSGLIVPISEWILAEACRQAALWQQRFPGKPPLYVSINVSGRHFSHPAFLGHVRAALAASGVSPEIVKIELTESIAMNDAPGAAGIMSQLRALGLRISIDDFGTGYSSLSYLRRFPVSTLKIDQSFVAAMHTDRESCAIVSTVVALGRNLGLEVVAEGVETASQFDQLASMGCDAVQGYLFSRPVPADAVGSLIDRNCRRDKHLAPGKININPPIGCEVARHADHASPSPKQLVRMQPRQG
jgi:diguanylate cyclase (GGDEF)-like protein/PAS domain S-box-containing protein